MGTLARRNSEICSLYPTYRKDLQAERPGVARGNFSI